MQNQKNCYENVWILSGTFDGPVLAKKLLTLNYIVFASVTTNRAANSYPQNPKLNIITGKLNNENEIITFIKKNHIRFVIDATHPFALIISESLKKACNSINIPLLVFERESLKNISNNFFYISSLTDIKKIDLVNKNILLAIGCKFLKETAEYYLKNGANVFARVLPTPESICKAFGSCIRNSNIAILEPSKNDNGILEKKLCEFWNIDYVLCRESGSYSQKNWMRIINESKMKLFLVKRPKLKIDHLSTFCDYDNLIDYLAGKN